MRQKDNVCSVCGSCYSENAVFCPSCNSHIGFPNVRRANAAKNRSILAKRLREAQVSAKKRGCYREFCKFHRKLKDSKVVIAMPAAVFRKLVTNPSELYCNYEKLVDSGVVSARSSQFDFKRLGVDGTLFGSYCNDIVFGVLSLTNTGLPTYGSVFCTLRPVTIQNRASVLEENSYRFIEKHKILAGGSIPNGYCASWSNRRALAAVKLEKRIESEQTDTQWNEYLFKSDATNRNLDEYIEVHIFGSFNREAVQCVSTVPPSSLDHDDKIDIDLGMSKFSKFRNSK